MRERRESEKEEQEEGEDDDDRKHANMPYDSIEVVRDELRKIVLRP